MSTAFDKIKSGLDEVAIVAPYIAKIEAAKAETEAVREGGMCALSIAEEDHRHTKIALSKANARADAAEDRLEEILAALKYARRFLKEGEHDTAYVDAALAKARGDG